MTKAMITLQKNMDESLYDSYYIHASKLILSRSDSYFDQCSLSNNIEHGRLMITFLPLAKENQSILKFFGGLYKEHFLLALLFEGIDSAETIMNKLMIPYTHRISSSNFFSEIFVSKNEVEKYINDFTNGIHIDVKGMNWFLLNNVADYLILTFNKIDEESSGVLTISNDTYTFSSSILRYGEDRIDKNNAYYKLYSLSEAFRYF